jgi:hypothetical protein
LCFGVPGWGVAILESKLMIFERTMHLRVEREILPASLLNSWVAREGCFRDNTVPHIRNEFLTLPIINYSSKLRGPGRQVIRAQLAYLPVGSPISRPLVFFAKKRAASAAAQHFVDLVVADAQLRALTSVGRPATASQRDRIVAAATDTFLHGYVAPGQ